MKLGKSASFLDQRRLGPRIARKGTDNGFDPMSRCKIIIRQTIQNMMRCFMSPTSLNRSKIMVT